MPNLQSVRAPLSLSQVISNFENWRCQRKTRGAIPGHLKEQAFSLVGSYSLTRICKALRLSHSDFKKECVSKGLISQKKQPAFVEVRSDEVKLLTLADQVIYVELIRVDGARMKIDAPGAEIAGQFVSQFLKG